MAVNDRLILLGLLLVSASFFLVLSLHGPFANIPLEFVGSLIVGLAVATAIFQIQRRSTSMNG